MRKRLFLIFTVLAICIGLFLANAKNAYTEEAALVKIWAQKKGASKRMPMRTDPPTLNIEKDTIVIWMNGVAGKEIQIVFEDGKTCRDVTANTSLKQPGFFMDAKNCYVTSYLPYTSTSALQFPEAGNFGYIVVLEDGTVAAKGKIMVKDKIKESN